jgi:hypothetical protein
MDEIHVARGQFEVAREIMMEVAEGLVLLTQKIIVLVKDEETVSWMSEKPRQSN